MRKLFTLVLVAISLQLLAEPRILIDGIHGLSFPEPNMTLVPDPAELFPEYDFDYLQADDINLEQTLVSGILNTLQDTIYFTVAGRQEVLYLRYAQEDSTNSQEPYFYLIDPSGAMSSPAAKGLAHVEFPAEGEWTLIYSAWNEGATSYEVGTGPHFYSEALLAPYDAVLQMTDNTYALFQGWLPELEATELDVLQNYCESGGGHLLLRETDMTMVDKPIIHIRSDRGGKASINLNFPGVPTFLKPDAQISLQDKYSRLTWDVHMESGVSHEILYEGRPSRPLNLITAVEQGSGAHLVNQSSLNLGSLRMFQKLEAGGYRYGVVDELEAFGSATCTFDQGFSELELSRFLQKELELEALKLGLSLSEAQTFFKEHQWVNRLLAEISNSQDICAIYNFSGQAYDDLIPLTGVHSVQDRSRVMWVFVKNLPAEKQGEPYVYESSEVNTHDPMLTLVDTYHEYGVIEIHNPQQTTLRDLDMHDFHFWDEFVVDETDNQGNSWYPIFHTFGEDSVAQLLSAGVEDVYGVMTSPISILPESSGFVVLSGDADTYSEGNDEFPQGSYPAVAVAQPFGAGYFIAVNDINVLNEHPGNVQFLRNCFNFLSHVENQVIHVPTDVATIQAAIDSSIHGDSILVAPGIYHENINFQGKSIYVGSLDNPLETIIHGDSSGSVVSFLGGETRASVLEGFTITGGMAYPIGPMLTGGAGIHIAYASPSILRNIITENYGDFYIDGGGILCNAASPLLKDNIVSSNAGAYRGGGIALLNGSNPTIVGNSIQSNTTQSGWGFAFGAGIYVGETSSPVIRDNLIQSNVIDVGQGGGIYLSGPGSQIISRNLIINNTGAGVASVDTNTCILINNTIVGNSEGIRTDSYAHPVLVNSIVWDNSIIIGSDIGNSDITVAYSNIQGGWDGLFNIDLDPLLGDAYTLAETSPCVDAGTNVYIHAADTVLYLTPADYRGNAPDMGVFESEFTSDLNPAAQVPNEMTLLQNYPNPFNPSTSISYAIPETGDVTLIIYDLMGRIVLEHSIRGQQAGWHQFQWNGSTDRGEALSSGLYFCRLKSESHNENIKMLLLK